MKSFLIILIAVFLGACGSNDIFYTARPDIHVTVYVNSNLTRKLRNYSEAQYLYNYTDAELRSIMDNALKNWADGIGYRLYIREDGDPIADDSSDYVVRLLKFEVTEQRQYKSVSQPATTNSPKMSADVKVRQVTVSFTANMHSNLNGTDREINAYSNDQENITAGYFQPRTPLFGSSSSTPSYDYICDIIPMSASVSGDLVDRASFDLGIRIDGRIHKEYRTKLRLEKQRQKVLMKGS